MCYQACFPFSFRAFPVLQYAGCLFAVLLVVGCAPDEQPSPEPPAIPVFEAQVIDDNISIGYGLAIGHVDNDEQPDILLADKTQFVWYDNGTWERHVLIENLTDRDNVAIAARDINGDGDVEIAVGAMWNPGETTDKDLSGAVHYLIQPPEPTMQWEPVQLPHDPTTHRMQWVKVEEDTYHLIVLPLHGIGNSGGEGDGVHVQMYTRPDDPRRPWQTRVLDDNMHLTHNFDVVETEAGAALYIAGKEGVRKIVYDGQWANAAVPVEGLSNAAGEVRVGALVDKQLIATIEPMHGNSLVAYLGEGERQRVVLDTTFAQGHALAVADILGLGRDQIVAGWRNPDANGQVGIRLYIPDETGSSWSIFVIDENTMACEDLKVADLNADGKLDIIAAGRATRNLVVYWNKSS